ncbi:MAG: hypothetical protein CMJ29_02980 [Phycisphaerae bacterium]|nr:hypothetical protein [Phycisphaerae bacterium]|tara:strand:+ start:153 stop:896 length:744 start_codon:yes stop_codon:yes gene_type:complete
MILLAHDSVSDLLSFGGGDTLPKEGPDRLLLPLGEFTMPWFLAALILGYVFAIVLSAIIAWHPRSLSASSAERLLGRERVLLLLGLIGATVAEIVMAEPAMALVIFGIGGLIRFRTRLPDEELNFKGILVVIIGLACGMSELALAVFVTIIGWLLIWFIDKSQPFRVRIACPSPEQQAMLRNQADHLVEAMKQTKLKVVNAAFDDKKRLVLYVSVPVSIDEHQLREIIRGKISGDLEEAKIRISPLS